MKISKHIIAISFIILSCPNFAQKYKDNFLDRKLNEYGLMKIADAIYDNGWIEFKQDISINPETIFDTYKSYFGLGEYDDMVLKSILKDKLGFSQYRFYQTYKGIRVEGMEYIIHAKNNKAIKANGKLVHCLNFNLDGFKLNANEALKRALQITNAEQYAWENQDYEGELKHKTGDKLASYYPKAEMMITLNQSANEIDKSNYFLTYKFEIQTLKPSDKFSIYIDAYTGNMIRKTTERYFADATGSGTTLYNGSHNFTTWERGWPNNDFILEDHTRGLIQTKNFGYSAQISDNDNNWTSNLAAISAHWAVQESYDYFQATFGRSGMNDSDKHVDVKVNWDEDTLNAYYSKGISSDEIVLGIEVSGYCNNLAAIDVVGHEYTHGITKYTADLNYEKESGALNESFSDIFSVLIQEYIEGYNSSRIYTLAEDPVTGGMRSMSNPHSHYQPSTYGTTDLYWYDIAGCLNPTNNNDYCGVHTNSGVQNYWFYLLAEGGSQNGVTVEGIGLDDAGEIVYRNLTTYLSSTSDYTDARDGAIHSAIDLFGFCSQQTISVIKAWDAVLVPANYNPGYDVIDPCSVISYFHGNNWAYSKQALNNFEADCSIADNKVTTFIAGNRILLTPGFKSGRGTNTSFRAYIQDCGVMKNPSMANIIVANSEGNNNLRFIDEFVQNIKEEYNELRIAVYPVPNDGIFYVEIFGNKSKLANITISNLFGDLIYFNSFNNPKGRIDISNQPDGVYFLKTIVNGEVHIEKFVKQ